MGFLPDQTISQLDDRRSGCEFLQEQIKWLHDLKNHLKGDTWEVEIMGQVIAEVSHQVIAAEKQFLQSQKAASLKSP